MFYVGTSKRIKLLGVHTPPWQQQFVYSRFGPPDRNLEAFREQKCDYRLELARTVDLVKEKDDDASCPKCTLHGSPNSCTQCILKVRAASKTLDSNVEAPIAKDLIMPKTCCRSITEVSIAGFVSKFIKQNGRARFWPTSAKTLVHCFGVFVVGCSDSLDLQATAAMHRVSLLSSVLKV